MPFYSDQLHAAYVLEDAAARIKKMGQEDQNTIWRLYQHAGTFECIRNFATGELGENSRVRILAGIAQNIVQRGIPTFAPKIVEELLSFPRKTTARDVMKSLVLVDKGYKFDGKRRYYQKNYNKTVTAGEVNDTEVGFLLQVASDENLKYLAQFMELQKPFEHVILHPNTDAKKYANYTRYCLDQSLGNLLDLVKEQRLDTGIELPKLVEKESCCAVELDGPTHEEPEQKSKDKMRDDILHELYWKPTVRITDRQDASQYSRQLGAMAAPLRSLLDSDASVLPEIQLPLHIAQVAETFLHLVESGEVSAFGGKDIFFAVDECTDKRIILYGIQNAVNILHHLGRLLNGGSRAVAPVVVRFGDGAFRIEPDGNAPEKTNIRIDDAVISLHISEHMCQRLYAFNPGVSKGHKIWLYSAYGVDSERQFHMAKPLAYSITDDTEDSLVYFLRDVFRKKDFRPKQAEIIRSALSRKNVIGLLPTGSGKTLTYQMSILLQPGVGMVVSPLVSLMEDEVDNLKRYLIDACATINGTVSGADKRLLLNRLLKKEFLFMYVAPERLQIRGFKEELEHLDVSTLVIDEAHCVSQWGHDFRTAYLRVGEIMQRHLKNYITMALTGTASCNVTTDIKRELGMTRNVDIVTPNDFRRPELHFKIIELESDKELKGRIQDGSIEDAIRTAVKDVSAQEEFRESEDGTVDCFFRHQNGEYANAGLIFCPFAKKEGESTEAIHERLFQEANGRFDVGLYHGQLEDEQKNKEQKSFTHGKTGLLVATKAFGMGIDKPNIRFTIHTAVPESIESFYQEAGRAGRDGKSAVNIILAPPVGIDYEDTMDKKIVDFFMDNSYPDKDNFLAQVRSVLETGFITDATLRKDLLSGIRELDIPDTEVNLEENANGHIILKILCGKGYKTYDATIDADGNTHFDEEKRNASAAFPGEDRTSILCRKFEESVKRSLARKMDANDKLNARTLMRSFDLNKMDTTESIAQILDRLKKNEMLDCYVGLDKTFMANWVDDILRVLIAVKKNSVGHPLLFTGKMYRDVMRQRRAAHKAKWKYHVEDFYPAFHDICNYNHLPLASLSEQDFKEVAEEARPNWTGAYKDVQDKVLYYMGVLGLYTDFERSYSPNYIRVTLKPVDPDDIKEHIKSFISGYETTDYVRRKVKFDWMEKARKPSELVYESLKYIIDYSYEKIRSYRLAQSFSMYRCIQAGGDSGDGSAFTDEVYKYFESKYSDELMRDVEHENLRLPMAWIEKITSSVEQGGNLLEDLSHLRTSALKVEEARPQAFTPYLLYAYATFRDHNLDIRNGITAYLIGQKRLQGLRQNYRTTLSEICEKALETEDETYLQEVGKIIDKDFPKENLDELKKALEKQLGKF